MTTMTSRELNQDVAAAKRAAADGPVVITDRGRPAFVLLSYRSFEDLVDSRSLVDRLRATDDIELEVTPLTLTAAEVEL